MLKISFVFFCGDSFCWGIDDGIGCLSCSSEGILVLDWSVVGVVEVGLLYDDGVVFLGRRK